MEIDRQAPSKWAGDGPDPAAGLNPPTFEETAQLFEKWSVNLDRADFVRFWIKDGKPARFEVSYKPTVGAADEPAGAAV